MEKQLRLIGLRKIEMMEQLRSHKLSTMAKKSRTKSTSKEWKSTDTFTDQLIRSYFAYFDIDWIKHENDKNKEIIIFHYCPNFYVFWTFSYIFCYFISGLGARYSKISSGSVLWKMYFFLFTTELVGFLPDALFPIVLEFLTGEIEPVDPKIYLILMILWGETSYFSFILNFGIGVGLPSLLAFISPVFIFRLACNFLGEGD